MSRVAATYFFFLFFLVLGVGIVFDVVLGDSIGLMTLPPLRFAFAFVTGTPLNGSQN